MQNAQKCRNPLTTARGRNYSLSLSLSLSLNTRPYLTTLQKIYTIYLRYIEAGCVMWVKSTNSRYSFFQYIFQHNLKRRLFL